MNVVYLVGRLTKDPEVTYTQGEKPMAIARYTLAVDKRSRSNDRGADFIRITAFGKNGEFAEKWLKKGVKVIVTGHINTSSYEKDGQRVWTTEIVADTHEFCESKNAVQSESVPVPEAAAPTASTNTASNAGLNDFMSIADSIDEELPFS